ncbi:unnamed protein product [Effrenium voratum]|nr:unnamed protein product [Effrenium voratum]
MPFLDFSYGVVPSRRHSPAPVRHDHRNEIVQALDAHEHTAILGRRARLSRSQSRRPEGREVPPSPARRNRSLPAHANEEDSSQYEQSPKVMRSKSGKGEAKDHKKAMHQSMKRLDTAAAKLEKVAKALVLEAQRQSLKRVD